MDDDNWKKSIQLYHKIWDLSAEGDYTTHQLLTALSMTCVAIHEQSGLMDIDALVEQLSKNIKVISRRPKDHNQDN